jgi:PTH1 family peptidyl-tRNA hydrolase
MLEQAPDRLVLGLGNPGIRYAETRHNAGFLVVRELARRWGVALDRTACHSWVGLARGTLLALPQTYMNRSGYAARCLMELHRLAPSRVLVVYDELALPLGRLRLRPAGSPAGHRGMESILAELSTAEVPRLRVGIASEDGPPSGEERSSFVLAPFAAAERERVDAAVARAADACELWLGQGIEAAMSRFNRDDDRQGPGP